MEQVSIIGLDIAKNVFYVHGIDAEDSVVVQRRLRRRQFFRSFNGNRHAWLAWKPVRHRVTGPERLKS